MKKILNFVIISIVLLFFVTVGPVFGELNQNISAATTQIPAGIDTSSPSDLLPDLSKGSLSHPVHTGSIVDGEGGALLRSPWDVFVSGNNAYVASYDNNALEVVDISDPAHPHHEGSIVDGEGGAHLNQPKSVFVSGDYAYVASYNGKSLEIINVSTPSSLHHGGSIVDGEGGADLNYPESVFVSGNYAYVTSHYGNSLEIINVSTPSSPHHEGNIRNGEGGCSPVLPGGRLCVRELCVCDI